MATSDLTAPGPHESRVTAIFRIATAISSCIEVQQALDMACESAVELLGVDHSGLVRFEADGTHGTVVAEFGHGINAKGMKLCFEDAPAEIALVQSGKCFVSEDVATAEGLGPVRDILLGLGIRSILIVPIVHEGIVLGSFSLDVLESRHFYDDELEICQDLARLIAIAIERAELFARVQAHNFHSDALRDATLAIGSALSRADVLSAIVHNAVKLVAARDAGVYLYDPQEKKLRLAAMHKHSEARIDKVLSLGEGMAGRLIESGKPYMMTPDYGNFPGRSEQFNDAPAFESVLEVPILDVNHRALGVLFVESSKGREYSEDEIQLIRQFSDHAAVSLRNAELVETQHRELQLLLQATHVLAKSNDLPAGLQELAELIVKFKENTFCRILLIDDLGECLEPMAAHAVERSSPFKWISSGQRVEIAEWPGLRGVLDAGAPVLMRYQDELARPMLERLSHILQLPSLLQSLLMVPLKLEDRLVGLIDIGEMRNESRCPFTKSKRALARAIARQITVSIDRLRQHQVAERRTRLLNELEEFSGYLVAIKEPSKLLQEFLRLATVLFPGTLGALFRNHRSLQELELSDTYPLSSAAKGQRISYEDPVLGRVVRNGIATAPSSLNEWPLGVSIFKHPEIRRFVATPLKIASDVEFVLVLADPSGEWLRPEPDLGILERFTARAAAALATSQLIHPDPRLTEQLSRLQPIGDYMQSAGDIDTILHAFLTGVTAGYGLSFNRGIVFLADDSRQYLDGKKAIGDRASWSNHVDPVNGFTEFIRARELGDLKTPPAEHAVTQLHLPLAGSGAFSKVVLDKRFLRLEPSRFDELPRDFVDVFQPVHQLLLVPLIADYQTIGLLVVDNCFSGAPITGQDLLSLLSFSHRAALTIQNRLVLEQALLIRSRLTHLHAASTRLLISEDPHYVAQHFVDELINASGASGSSVLFIDEGGRLKDRLIAGTARPQDHLTVIRPNGFSMQVMQSGKPVIIEDAGKELHRLNPATLPEEMGALICLPLMLSARPIGVLWLTYRDPRRFTEEEKNALQLYAEQAAIAYGSAQTLAFSQRLYALAQVGPDQGDPKGAMTTIVELARQTFEACSATIWPYDGGSGRFIPQDLVSVGIPPNELNIFRNAEPGENHTTQTALSGGYLEVTNIEDHQYEFLSPPVRALLKDAGIASFQASSLKSGDESLGVLYVSYPRVRGFGPQDRVRLETFSKGAAQILKHVRLVTQISKARQAAHTVAEISVLGRERETLRSIGEKTRDVVGCDSVVLFEFNQATNRFSYPYTMVGVKHRNWEGKTPGFPGNTWILDKLSLTEEEIVDRVDEHPEYKTKRFAKAEDIKTFMLIPLHASRRKVGLMFVNFCHYHRFTEEERNDIRLFAHHASVAIRNEQILGELVSLEEFSKKLLGCITIEEIAKAAVQEAMRNVGVGTGNISLMEEKGGFYTAASVGFGEAVQSPRPGPFASHAAFAIEKGCLVVSNDLALESQFEVPAAVREQGFVSAISTCIYHENKPIGALLLYSNVRREFGDYEGRLLQAVADQATVAMQGVRLFQREAERRVAYSRAMFNSTKAITTSSRGLESGRIFAQILEEAVNLVDGRAFLCTVHSLRGKTVTDKKMVLEAVFPEEEHERLKLGIGGGWALNDKQPIGITGRAALLAKTQVVDDVTQDPDYVPFSDKTRSELAVPLFDPSLKEVVGVLNIESSEPAAFTSEHFSAIEALGEIAVIVIQNAREHEFLEETITRLDARAALAWIGMTAGHWRHDIDTKANTMRFHIEILRKNLCSGFQDPLLKPMLDKLAEIQRLVDVIQKTPITPPLSSEEGRSMVRLNDLVRERCTQLWQNEPYSLIRLERQFQISEDASALVSSEWLRRALDLLIDNAVKELQNVEPERRELNVTTREAPGGMEIVFRDHGRGIAQSIQDQLFKSPVSKGPGDRGLGIGLLMAQAIVEAYGGKLRMVETGPHGTSMAIWFPRQPL